MNAYYTGTNTNAGRRLVHRDSDAIRRAYIASTRKKAIVDFFESFASGIDSAVLFNIILSFKIISGIVCGIGFLAVIGLIEAGTISFTAGIACTVIIALLECLCFIPMGNKKRSRK